MTKYQITIDATGPNGNIFAILGQARVLLKELGDGDLVEPLTQKVMGSHSYHEACDAIAQYFSLRLDGE